MAARHYHFLTIALIAGTLGACQQPGLRGTGDLGLVVERAQGRVNVIETTGNSVLGAVPGLGDLSHASAVFSRDGRYAYVFGRDGGLSKVDVLARTQPGKARTVQAGNSIGGAISQDGRLVAVSNYRARRCARMFDAETLAPVADIPAEYWGDQTAARSKVVGLVDAPGQRFVFSLYRRRRDLGGRSDPTRNRDRRSRRFLAASADSALRRA